MSAAEELAQLRKRIDELDEELVHLLARRFAVTADIGQLKTVQGLASADPQREADHLSHIGEIAKQDGLEPEFVQSLLQKIMTEVVRRHNEIEAASRGYGYEL